MSRTAATPWWNPRSQRASSHSSKLRHEWSDQAREGGLGRLVNSEGDAREIPRIPSTATAPSSTKTATVPLWGACDFPSPGIPTRWLHFTAQNTHWRAFDSQLTRRKRVRQPARRGGSAGYPRHGNSAARKSRSNPSSTRTHTRHVFRSKSLRHWFRRGARSYCLGALSPHGCEQSIQRDKRIGDYKRNKN